MLPRDSPPDLQFANDMPRCGSSSSSPAASVKELNSGNNPWMWNGWAMPSEHRASGRRLTIRGCTSTFWASFVALDLKTGKLLWRSGKFHDIVAKTRQSNGRIMPEQYGLCVAEDRVFFVARDPAKNEENQRHFMLSCREKATGKEIWTSEKVEALKKWHVWGAPVATKDRVYVSAFAAEKGRDLHMLAVNAADGKLLWSTHCGTYQVDESQLYNQRSSQPALVLDGERLYLDTQIGSMILFDARTGSTLWGFNYDAEAPTESFWFYHARKSSSSGAAGARRRCAVCQRHALAAAVRYSALRPVGALQALRRHVGGVDRRRRRTPLPRWRGKSWPST